jgi:hypothetical protein
MTRSQLRRQLCAIAGYFSAPRTDTPIHSALDCADEMPSSDALKVADLKSERVCFALK